MSHWPAVWSPAPPHSTAGEKPPEPDAVQHLQLREAEGRATSLQGSRSPKQKPQTMKEETVMHTLPRKGKPGGQTTHTQPLQNRKPQTNKKQAEKPRLSLPFSGHPTWLLDQEGPSLAPPARQSLCCIQSHRADFFLASTNAWEKIRPLQPCTMGHISQAWPCSVKPCVPLLQPLGTCGQVTLAVHILPSEDSLLPKSKGHLLGAGKSRSERRDWRVSSKDPRARKLRLVVW